MYSGQDLSIHTHATLSAGNWGRQDEDLGHDCMEFTVMVSTTSQYPGPAIKRERINWKWADIMQFCTQLCVSVPY